MSEVARRLGAPALRPSSSLFARLHGRSGSDWAWASLPGPLSAFAVEAELNDDHMSALLLWVGFGAFLATAGSILGGLAQGLVMGLLVGLVPSAIAWRWSGRRTKHLVAALPELVDMVGRSLRSGASLMQALHEATADSPPALAREFDVVLAAMRRGQPASQALRSWAERLPRAEVRIVAAALAIASHNEAGTSRALDGVSQSLRDRSALRSEIRSQTAQAAASMQALVLLPVVFLCVDALSSGQTVRFLWAEPLGRVCLALAVMLDIVGGMWISAVVRRRSPT